MELNYRLNAQQKRAIQPLDRLARKADYSWVLTHHQGTGLKFWRITLSDKPEWDGDLFDVDGRTVTEAVSRACSRISVVTLPEGKA